jgi:predicted GNAT family N-acyltransferase
MIVVGNHLADAVTEPDTARLRGRSREEHFRRRGMGIFVEEMMLDFPRIVVAELVRERDLGERLMEQALLVALLPGPRQLQFVENAKPHLPARAADSRRRFR